jgi:hypothetical protein
MATALGHATHRPRLLERYLPKPIQDFFCERWIRLFQAGIICHVMKDSPFLLEASSFRTMQELDLFLENHALRCIPSHLDAPDESGAKQPAAERHAGKIIFGVEEGVLALLLSIELAVKEASHPPGSRAIRWARVSERLFDHLEAQTGQPDLGEMAKRSRLRADAAKVQHLIYE